MWIFYSFTAGKCGAFLWRYEPVRRTGKSVDWLTIFFARITRFTDQKCQLFWVIFCIMAHFNFVISQNAKWGMLVFTLIATGWLYRKYSFTKKHWVNVYFSQISSAAIGLSRQMDRRCGGVRDRSSMGINSGHVLGLRLSITQRISRTR